ncbi:tRNA-methyltransferase non-catalytic subunit trm6MTase subunit [Melia azedarach]|uniref:tRNA-methyltransferase non-catalytic subunit trm6MTase subunit n=1 Tax=Melia azedarach TaxID=155640 RepID=A0ACC1XUB6_MELAZ|nr:tRNA-methyltransferase non-catalytic subunit trm6MTase subunit [Melia azedarach]
MDAFNYDNCVEDYAERYGETEEEKALLRRNFKMVADAIHHVELSLALFVVSWFLLRLPITARILGELLRRLLGLMRSPFFVFVLLSVGYLAFMLKSYRASARNLPEDNAGNYIHENIIDISQFQGIVELEEVGVAHEVEYAKSKPFSKELVEEAVYEDKEIVCVVNSTSTPKCEVSDEDADAEVGRPRVSRRSQSEFLESEVNLQQQSEEAEPFQSVDPQEVLSENLCPPDELNDEEFKETIDAFIKKQRQFRSHEIRHDYYRQGRNRGICYY